MLEPQLDQPATCPVKAQGALDRGWADRVEGMCIDVSAEPDAPPLTILSNLISDQAALESV